MRILAIDPGTTESGWVNYCDGRLHGSGVMSNADLLRHIGEADWANLLAIEMVASYGMPVGAEVFETCVWIGRFQQAWRDPGAARFVYRKDVKMHLCGSARAKDANIRQALIDIYGPGKEKAIGKKASPGPLFGVTSHAWPALAVAVTAHSQLTALRSAA